MPPCTIDDRHPSYRNGAKDAAKRHRSFGIDLTQVLLAIQKDAMSVGDQVRCADPRIHARKVRIGCAKERVAPRNGYRLIFQVLTINAKVIVKLLDCYYKPMQSDVLADAVKRLADLAVPGIPPED